MTEEQLKENNILFNELYEKTKDCGRVQFINLLMEKEREIKELKKQLKDLFNENSNLRKKLEKSMTFQDYEYTLNKKIQLENQQKEFIEWLEANLEALEMCDREFILTNNKKEIKSYKEVLSKYKEIIGVKDE